MTGASLRTLTPIKTQSPDGEGSGPSTPGLSTDLSSVPSSAFSMSSRQASWGLDMESSMEAPRSMKLLRRGNQVDLDVDELLEQLQVSELPSKAPKKERQLFELVGEGTHARVYRTIRSGTILAAKIASSKSADACIRRERRVLEYIAGKTDRLDHVIEHFHGDDLHGRATLYMELGQSSLLDRLQAQAALHKTTHGPLFGMQAWQDHAMMIASGLQALHEIGIVHGDIKPQNIIVMSDSRLKLIDFESAFTPDGALERHEESGHDIMGSNIYAAPELLRMNNDGATFESDMYSLGVTLLVLATGEEPYSRARNGIQVILQCQSADPIRFTVNKHRLTPEIEGIIRPSCAKVAQERWDIYKVLRALESLA